MTEQNPQSVTANGALKDSGEALRVGFVCITDPSNPMSVSGMPYRAKTGLEQLGVDIVPLFPHAPNGRSEMVRALKHRVPSALRRSAAIRALRSMAREGIQSGVQRLNPTSAYDQVIQRARIIGADITQQIATLQRPLDVLFGICISTPLYGIETNLPIVYCSDATARLIMRTYSGKRRTAGKNRAHEELEQSALSRVDAAIFPSNYALESAVDDYGLPRERAHLVPLGASVRPDAHDTIFADLPSRERLELIIVAADPVRKRLDLCVEVTRVLADRGWNVTLHSIGGHTRAAAAYERVRIHGRLSMADPIDREIHKAMLRRSHFMLLPSVGEMFGIAPAEAAHFGRPSLVSAVGGLTSVVRHGETGLCIPVDAPAEVYADEIARITEDPDVYRTMSTAALGRANGVLNWPAFSRGVLEVLERVVRDRSPSPE